MPGDPYTPEEDAAEARRIVDEGGSMIHIHARRPDGRPTCGVERVEKRVAYLRELRPVGKARAMAEDGGRRVATVAEARELLGV